MRAIVAAFACSCLVLLVDCRPAANGPPLLSLADRGGVHRAVTARTARAQAFFDQGLALTFGFDHEEAIRAFERAVELDPECAMGWWGVAYAAGPNINNPVMDEERSRTAWEALQKALPLASRCTPVEKALVGALAKRYAWPAPPDRRSLDVAYADAMRDVYRAYPEDADIGALFAEALMDLRPWDLWSAKGEPRPETPEIIQVLEAVLERDPDHPGACHDYIHTVEASPHPERALGAADHLRHRVPGAGHLVHMPSHIDIRLGRYPEAILANQRGIEADQRRVRRAGSNGRGGFYALYRAHNYHFLVYAAMFDGRRELAVHAARELRAELPLEVVGAFPDFFDAFLATPYHACIRFGLWDEILREPAPPADLPVTTAAWHYARGIALASLGRVDEAASEQEAFEQTYERVPETAYAGNNAARTVLAIGRPMLAGELEYRRGNHEQAFALLREAVARDDSLRYDEPWGWMQPVRHALGALLLEQDRIAEAEAVYREDLRLHPDNGWALHGLAECLRRTDRTAEATAVDQRFRSAWARADIPLHASCFCRRGS